MEAKEVRCKIANVLFPKSHIQDSRFYKPMWDRIDKILEEYTKSLTD